MNDPLAASLIRRFVDGELDAAEAARLQQRLDADPVLRAAVAHERALRERVGTVLRIRTPATPAELADRVRSAFAEAGDDTTATRPAPVAANAASAPAPDDEFGPRWRWLVGPQRANVFAVAAVLAIIVGAVVIGIRFPKIDQLGRTTESNLAGVATLYLSGEHGRCATSPEHLGRQLPWVQPARAEAAVAEHLGLPWFHAPDLSAQSYDFTGAGRCGVPGATRSVHLLYRRRGDAAMRPMVSVWVVPDEGQYDSIVPGGLGRPWSAIERGSDCAHDVLCRTDGRLVYFLVCCDDNDLANVAPALSAELDPRVR